VCVPKDLCIGTITTDDEMTTVFNLELTVIKIEGDTDFINVERAKCNEEHRKRKL